MREVMFILVIGFLFISRSTALVDDPEQERLSLQALLDALHAARITHKEAYMSMHIDKSQWSRILRLEARQPSNTQLLNLPRRFWREYIPRWTMAVAREHVTQIAEDLLFKARRDRHPVDMERIAS